MCSPSDPSSPASADSNSASNGPASGPCDGKSSATSSASECSPSTGPESAGIATSAASPSSLSQSTSSAEDSPARMSPARVAGVALMASALACGPSSLVSLLFNSPPSSLSKTWRVGLRYGSTLWCETWSSKAMKRYRSRCRQLMSALATHGRESSSLRATLTAKGNLLAPSMQKWKGHHAFRKWVGKPLNPAWCEWDMGFPAGWTDLGSGPSATRSSRSARKRSGG